MVTVVQTNHHLVLMRVALIHESLSLCAQSFCQSALSDAENKLFMGAFVWDPICVLPGGLSLRQHWSVSLRTSTHAVGRSSARHKKKIINRPFICFHTACIHEIRSDKDKNSLCLNLILNYFHICLFLWLGIELQMSL